MSATLDHHILVSNRIFNVLELLKPLDQGVSMEFPLLQIERDIMIASNDNLGWMLKSIELLHELLDLLCCSIMGKVSGMYQDISFGYVFEAAILAMGI